MQQQLINTKCRVCKKVTKHGNLDAANEMKLGDGVALLQCLECGVMGIEQIEVKENG